MTNKIYEELQLSKQDNDLSGERTEEFKEEARKDLKKGSKEYAIDKVLDTWNDVEKDKKSERIAIAKFLKYLVVFELLSILVLVIFKEILHLDSAVISTIVGSVFLQTLGLVFIVVKYLFDDKSDKYLDNIAKILSTIKDEEPQKTSSTYLKLFTFIKQLFTKA